MTDPVMMEIKGAQTAPGSDELIPVPSGQPVSLMDVVWNVPGPDGLTLRFRFLAPQIARDRGEVDYPTASADMMHLCQTYALARLAEFGPQPAQIIISLSDVPVPFGEAVPEATQFFDAFTYQDGTCIWEMY